MTEKTVQNTKHQGLSKLFNYTLNKFTSILIPRLNCTITDFEIYRRLGGGSCSTVIEAKQKSTGDKYAIKMVDKNMVIKNKLTAAVSLERRVLDRMDFIGIAKLHFTFQDQIHICTLLLSLLYSKCCNY